MANQNTTTQITDNSRFDKIFWFVCALCAAVFLIDVSVFFVPIAQSGQKYVDNNLPILNTGAMMAGIYYLLGGNPKTTNNSLPVAATNSGDIKVG